MNSNRFRVTKLDTFALVLAALTGNLRRLSTNLLQRNPSLRMIVALVAITILALAGATKLAQAQTESAGRQAPAVNHNTWTSGAPLPTGVLDAAAAVLKGEIYVIGGVNSAGTIIADTQIYNPATNAWSTGISYPTAIGAANAAVVKNVLYVFGGTSDGVNPTNAVWAYNPKTKTWTAKAAMPTARWQTGTVVEKNIVYVSGGVVNGSGNGILATVESYNPATDTWTEETPMLVAKGAPAAGLLGTTIVVADGATNGQGDTGDNEGYNATTNTWTTLAADPTARYGSCFGSIGPQLYDVGGQPSPTATESFKLSKNKWTTTLRSHAAQRHIPRFRRV